MRQLKHLFALLLSLSICSSALAQNTLKIQNGTTITLSSNVIFTINNLNLDNDGTFSPAAGAGRVVFTGNANNSISGNGTIGFDQLEIAKSNAASLTIQRDFDIRSGIWFTSGKIDLNNRTITLLGNAVLNNESENSRLVASNGGYIQTTIQLDNPQFVNPGNLGAIITTSQNLGLTTIRRGHSPQAVAAGQTSIQRYYDILPANNTGLNASLRMNYFTGELNGHIESALEFRRSADQLTWTHEGATLRNEANNFVELQGINAFSSWTLAGSGAALPVQFISFHVQCRNEGAVITWATAQEVNSSHFIVQSSNNGSNWQNIATIAAAGNSNTQRSYSYTDALTSGKLYRIKQADIDGTSQYSTMVMADCASDLNWNFWPNPVSDKLMISMKSVVHSMSVLSIYDNRGRLVKRQNQALLAGNNLLHVDVRTLANGYYHVELMTGDGQVRKTAMVLKQ